MRPNVTLSEFCDAWLPRLRSRLRPQTILRYRYALERQAAPLRDKPLREITRADLKAWVQQLYADDYGRGSIALYVAVVRLLLGDAVDDGIIPANPAQGLIRAMRLPSKYGDAEPLALTAEELSRVLETARRLFPNTGYPCLLLMSHTGLRIGEAIGLKWCDVDLDAATLRVNRQLLYRGATLEAPPKTARARRTIDLPAVLVSALRSLRVRQLEAALAEGREAGPYVLFPDFDPSRGTSTGLRGQIEDWLRAAAGAAGLQRRYHPHCLRHTFAFLHVEAALRSGAELRIKWLCDQLGHATIKETLDTYVRHRQVSDPGAAERFAAIVKNAGPGQS